MRLDCATEIRDRVRNGNVTARAVVSEALDRVGSVDGEINAFLSVHEEEALREADRVDDRLADGTDPGPLAGVPFAVKDNLCVEDRVTTAGSQVLSTYVPPFTATAVRRLRQAGAIPVGKTNMDEFAMGSSGENSAFGPTRNPWDPERVPGGSSSGSAAAVASRCVPLALGSDTGGSIRQPAAMCGVTGLKPSYGRVSRYGLIAYASSLDQVGPITTSMQDANLVLSVMAGPDGRDGTCVAPDTREVVPVESSPEIEAGEMTIGIPEEFFGDGIEDPVQSIARDALEKLRENGMETKTVSLPHTEYGIPAYYLIAPSEASSNLARFDGVHIGLRSGKAENLRTVNESSREAGFGPEVKRRILLGTFSLSTGYRKAYYNRALKTRRLIKQDFDEVFEEVDVVAGPTSPLVPFSIGERVEDPLKLYLCDSLTVTCNLAGLPGASIPCGYTEDGHPVGLQFIGPAFEERRLIQVASFFQERTDYHRKLPSVSADGDG